MLSDKLKARIAAEGPITVADYMAACLYDPDYGYYTTQNPLGAEGDFITAPELSQIFGELLGLWAADLWLKWGRPAPFTLLEAGPGRGTLMSDMLRAIKQTVPDMLQAMQVMLVEVSPTLQAVQQQTLAAYSNITWHTSLPESPLPMPVIALGNEVLDAFPVRQFVRDGDVYKERLITVQNETFTFTTAPSPTLLTGTAPLIETADAALCFVEQLKNVIQTGALLLIDYGGSGEGDTLQAMRKHSFADVLQTPGQADLTTHVNFDNVMATLGSGALGPVDMGLFLMQLGLPVRATALMENATPEQKKQIEASTRKLLDPNDMGRHFKVVGYITPNFSETQQPAGFAI